MISGGLLYKMEIHFPFLSIHSFQTCKIPHSFNITHIPLFCFNINS